MAIRRSRVHCVIRNAERDGYIIQEMRPVRSYSTKTRTHRLSRSVKPETDQAVHTRSWSNHHSNRNTSNPMPSGVSVIVCTKRPQCINNVFRNYMQQRFAPKELIIIINQDAISIEPYERRATGCSQVRTFRMPERKSLGQCLNFGVKRAKYNVIAKFDDDDYYAPDYLTDAVRALHQSGADVVGKRAHYVYLKGIKRLLLRFPAAERKFVRSVAGATLVVRKHVFNKVQFPNRTIGEDVAFCRACVAKGMSIYSMTRHNYAAIRRPSTQSHTWQVSYQYLLSMPQAKPVPCTGGYQRIVNRSKTAPSRRSEPVTHSIVEPTDITPVQTTPPCESDEGFSDRECTDYDDD